MKAQLIKDLLDGMIRDPDVKEIKIASWQECGEFNGDDPRPIITITKHDKHERRN